MKRILTVIFALACAAVLSGGSASAQVHRPATLVVPNPSSLAQQSCMASGYGCYPGLRLPNGRVVGHGGGYPDGYRGGGIHRPAVVNVWDYARHGVPAPYVTFNRSVRRSWGYEHGNGNGYGRGVPHCHPGDQLVGNMCVHHGNGAGNGYGNGNGYGGGQPHCHPGDQLVGNMCVHHEGGPAGPATGPGPGVPPPYAVGPTPQPQVGPSNGDQQIVDDFAQACAANGNHVESDGQGAQCVPGPAQ